MRKYRGWMRGGTGTDASRFYFVKTSPFLSVSPCLHPLFRPFRGAGTLECRRPCVRFLTSNEWGGYFLIGGCVPVVAANQLSRRFIFSTSALPLSSLLSRLFILSSDLLRPFSFPLLSGWRNCRAPRMLVVDSSATYSRMDARIVMFRRGRSCRS